ncbi:disintegrin and metalloproteinase domain-containing protein 20 [Trichechus manatus latirostris]|uniref:Disintegrin and metalloproteinase domain-containing protein 20 n=1 Tax=Trichechus manatus latirostris TaxID=127582 RepID=A0A2Y9QEZ3_TRIMA|nr:disintegrin and metalloproteinase domain-containing protein 20 [Trichechus manatus latirostris]
MPCPLLFWTVGSIMAGGEGLVHIRVIPLLLWVGASLSVSGHSQARPSQHFISPEVMIPLKVTGRGRSARAPGWLSYSLRLGGQRHIVHMRVKKFLVSKHLPVFTYTDQRALREDQPFVPDNCYYHGYVEGVFESLVALSTCFGGFRGVLQINGLTYEIEPRRHSATFEHLVYKIDSNETQFSPMRCGLTEEEIARQLELQKTYNSTLKQSSYHGWWTHRHFLELVVVVDYNRFLHSLRNTSVVQQEVFIVVHIVDSLYGPFDVDVILIGIEIWNEGNPSLSNDIDQVAEEFSIWKKLHLDARLPSDTTHLFIKQSFADKLGIAYVRGICVPPFNCGVDSFQGNQLFSFALIVTHELGHNLGMLHDTKWCVCEQKWCIMFPSQKITTKFSNCSYAEYWDNTIRKGVCLRSPPNPEKIFRVKFCGNLMVEEGEECDCGTIHQCANDPCCLSNCTLSPGAACAFGLCCKDCNFIHSGYLCRQQVSECDLPEWCSGTFHQCPEDVYVQNGIPCNDSAYCYEKRCNSHDTQCKEIFGKDARSASQSCYQKINTQGNRFGHCGITDIVYLKCETPDILCGRIQCENVGVIPNLTQHSTVHQIHFNGTTCWGTDYHLGMSIPDIGQVKDGTVCGLEKICIHNKCVHLSYLPQDCQPETCNMRGICNNKQHCHCDHGWAPPYCLMKGYGGSDDSGPPYNVIEEVGGVAYPSLWWLIPLIILFFYFILVLCKTDIKEKEEKEEEKDENKEQEEE